MSWTSADGAHQPEPLTKGHLQTPFSFTSDGKLLFYFEQNAGNGALIQMAEVKSDSGKLQVGQPKLFLETSSSNPFPAVSYDGKWVAYAAAGTGAYEIYVRSFPDGRTQWPVSTNGGSFPMWSRNGRELFYRSEDNRIMVVTYTVKGDSFIASPPRLWSDKQILNVGLVSSVDLAPDGNRIAVLFPAESAGPAERQNHVTLFLNFFDELRGRLAAGAK
jgi:WD40-like Beta Propeller Repeat